MSCEYFSQLISRYLDDALDEAERDRLFDHLGRCASCRLKLARYQSLEERLRQLPAERPPASCRQLLFVRAEQSGAKSVAFPTRRPMAITSASAAIVAVLLCGFLLFAPGRLDSLDGPSPFVSNRASWQSADVSGAPVVGGSVDGPVRMVGYIPPLTGVEKVALDWNTADSDPAYVRIVLLAPRGTRIRVERTTIPSPSAVDQGSAPEQLMWIHGHVWRYSRQLGAGGVETIRLVRSTGMETIVLEGHASIDDLVQLLEWLE